MLAISLLIVLLVALGAAGFWVFSRFFHTGNQMTRMVERMLSAPGASFDGSFVRFSKEESRPFTFGFFEARGAVALLESPPVTVRAEVEAGLSSDRNRIRFTLARDKETFRARVTEAPASFLGPFSDAVLNQWFLIESHGALMTLLGEESGLPLETPEKLDAFRQLVRETDWFHAPKGTITEILHGRVTRLYTSELNADAVVEFDRALFLLLHDREPSLEEHERIEVRRAIWSATRMNLWIDSADGWLHRALIQFADVSELDVLFEEHPGTDIHAEEVVDLPDADIVTDAERVERLPVVPPQDDEPVDGTEGDWDNDGLLNEQELFYGTDPRNADTDSDGYMDGEEVKNGYNPSGDGTLFNFGLPTL